MSIEATGQISGLGQNVVLALDGSSYVGVTLNNAMAFTGWLSIEYSMDGGQTWDENIFFNGDNYVGADILPHPSEPVRKYTCTLNPADTHIRVIAIQHTSGTTNVRIVNNNQVDPIMASGLGAIDFSFPIPFGEGGSDMSVPITTFLPECGFWVQPGDLQGTFELDGQAYSHGDDAWKLGLPFVVDGQTVTQYTVDASDHTIVEIPRRAAVQRYRLRLLPGYTGSAIVHGRITR